MRVTRRGKRSSDGRDFQLIEIQISEVVQLSSGSLWSGLLSVWFKDLLRADTTCETLGKALDKHIHQDLPLLFLSSLSHVLSVVAAFICASAVVLCLSPSFPKPGGSLCSLFNGFSSRAQVRHEWRLALSLPAQSTMTAAADA